MVISISPLELILDGQNPRFVTINQRDPMAMRKYMSTYEDVCSLAQEINSGNGLLLGERIVVILENEKYVVMEGNRRTCALQFLLDRNLIPDGFQHKINVAEEETLKNIKSIEVDVAPDRNYAIRLMAKRHIDGVKQWKPLAKKQFFASMFMNGNSSKELSERTGITASAIQKDIRDYKFLLKASNDYKNSNPGFDDEIINYKIDPFLRIFSANQKLSSGVYESPKNILKMKYDNMLNTKSDLPGDIFKQIVQLVFKATIVDKLITTRNTLFQVEGVEQLLNSLDDTNNNTANNNTPNDDNHEDANNNNPTEENNNGSDSNGRGPNDTQHGQNNGNGHTGNAEGNGPSSGGSTNGNGPSSGGSTNGGGPSSGGPTSGGGSSITFFEHISWNGKLIPGNRDHDGLIAALNELYLMSNNNTRKDSRTLKVYEAYPIAAGMLLRTVYEQALILHLKRCQPQLWADLKREFPFPMLGNIETKVSRNIGLVFPESDMLRSFNSVMSARSRDFLNANIHNPGLIRATAASLVGLANSGMLSLIQLIINAI